MTEKTYYDLIAAVKQGYTTDVEALLRKGANPNVLGRSLRQGEGRISVLAIAIERSSVEIVALLLKHGANLHDIDHLYSAPAPIGPTTSALHFLCGVRMPPSRWCAIARALLDHGVQVDARNRAGLSALQLCTDAGMDECRSFLIEAGADELAQSAGIAASGVPTHAAPLHRLAHSGQWKNGLLKRIKAGMDIDAPDPDQNSPLDLAVAHAVQVSALGPDRATPACQAIHAWIAAGAKPSALLLAAHPEQTPIGDALRMFRIDAAVACGDQNLVWHVLESDHDKQDADCQAAGARLDLRDGSPGMAEALDLWLASGFGSEALEPHPIDERSIDGCNSRFGA